MPLADLIAFDDNTVSVVPRTGVQFIDLGFAVDKGAGLPTDWGFRDDGAAADAGYVPGLVHRGGAEAGGESYGINLRQIVAYAERQWLPLPLFREEPGGGYFRGPTNWARCQLVSLAEPDRAGNRYRLIVAIDTGLLDFFENEAYLAPSPDDARNGRSFSLPRIEAGLDWFLREDWVRDWLRDAFRDMLERDERKRAGRKRSVTIGDADLAERMADQPREHLARYLAFLDLLQALDIVPRLRVIDRFTEPRSQPIDVDLVLDLGNSRSCALLIERHPGEGGSDVTQAFRLRLRDLSMPEYVHDEPFDSRLEFARATFGRDQHSLRSGRGDAFAWPTVVRVGPEAVRLAGKRRGSEGNTGMSSPKRYLWDLDQRKQNWRFGADQAQGGHGDFATGAAFTTLVNEWGEPIHRLRGLGPADPRWFPAIRALYARSHLMTFALAEIFHQAMTMMNAPAHRLRRRNADLPRRLRRIIMTIPTAMPMAERALLNERAESARDLVYLCLGLETQPTADGGAEVAWTADLVKPDLLLRWDEASATQAVYLYAEIAQNHQGDARKFFAGIRLPDRDPGDGLARLATLDIGGGTTDLVVSRYAVDGDGTNVSVVPTEVFREGFNLAGDDAVLRIAIDHVREPIRRALAEAGLGARADILLDRLLGADRGNMDVADQLRRRQFAVQIAQPIAIGLLGLYETADPLAPEAIPPRPFASFFPAEPGVSSDLIGWIDEAAAKEGAAGFDLTAVAFPVDIAEIDRSVRAVLVDPLTALAEALRDLRCDMVLLGGRTSRLPAVRAILAESGVLPPHRILPLHAFKVGAWYPFRDADGRIGDPKTTAAVGALICLLAEGRLRNFSFQTANLQPRSTARVFGKIDKSRITAADVYLKGLDLDDEDQDLPDHSFEFRTQMRLGFRQLPVEWWPATQAYRLDWDSDEQAEKYKNRLPIHVSVGRRLPRAKAGAIRVVDDFRIAGTVDADGASVGSALKLTLQTLEREEGYWLDTGVLA